MWSELDIGSNRVLNASGLINVAGKDQVHLERGAKDHQLLLTMDIYNAGGKHVAKLRRNAWAFHDGAYEITTNPASLRLVHRASSTVLAEAQVQDRDRIIVPYANFFAETGLRIVALPHVLQVGGLQMAGNVFDGVGTVLRIG